MTHSLHVHNLTNDDTGRWWQAGCSCGTWRSDVMPTMSAVVAAHAAHRDEMESR